MGMQDPVNKVNTFLAYALKNECYGLRLVTVKMEFKFYQGLNEYCTNFRLIRFTLEVHSEVHLPSDKNDFCWGGIM